MSCEKIREIMSAEMDGEAAEEQLIKVYQHLAECAGCRKWRREVLAVHGAFATGKESPLPASIAEKLHEYENATDQTEQAKRIYRPLAWATAAAVVLSVGWSSFQLAQKPASTIADEIAETIILSSRDKTSSAVMVRSTQGNEPGNNRQENGG